MPLRRRRPLVRAAAVGGVAYAGAKAGANAAGDEADPNAPAEEPEAEEQTAAADPASPAPSADESMDELTKLKGLLDSGVLTQDEFDAQKQKILQSM
jgi:membrane protease subunit (stomatin/prohibitin family)